MARSICLIVAFGAFTVVLAEPPAKDSPEKRVSQSEVSQVPVVLDGDKPRQGPRIELHSNGTPKVRANYRNGLLNGPYLEYAANGRNSVKAQYTDGRLHGEFTQWTEKGEMVRAARYSNGKLHGTEQKYVNGKLDGEWSWWDGELIGPSASSIKARLASIAKADVKGPGSEGHKNGVRRLMMYRFLCGVPYEDLELDEKMNAEAEAASIACEKLRTLTHRITENPGLPADVFEMAKRGAGNSNLAVRQKEFAAAVDGYMEDSDRFNISHVGHRRWCLNPSMLKVGFGKSGEFSAMWTRDKSRTGDFQSPMIAHPPRGPIPRDMFAKEYAWSITPNPQRFATIVKSKVNILIWRIAPTAKIDPQAFSDKNALPLDFFILNADFGGPCLIFRPTGVTLDAGTKYRVEVRGLTTKDGKSETLKYWVEFY